MKKYSITISNMSGQHHYVIKTNKGEKEAKQMAMNRHRELGREKESDSVYVNSVRNA